MESRLVRACGCVVHTAEDGAETPAWCSEHANAAAVAMTNRERAEEVCRELATIAASFAIGASAAACHEASLSAVERAIDAANRAAVDVNPAAAPPLHERIKELETALRKMAHEPQQIFDTFMHGPDLHEQLIDEWVCVHCGCRGEPRATDIEHADDCEYVMIDRLLASPAVDMAPSVDDVSRCAVCGWHLTGNIKSGCVRGNCSLRPRPDKLYAPVRAAREERRS